MRRMINVGGCASSGENSSRLPRNFRADLSPALRYAALDIVAGGIVRRPPSGGEGRNCARIVLSPEAAALFTRPAGVCGRDLHRAADHGIWSRNSRVRAENG